MAIDSIDGRCVSYHRIPLHIPPPKNPRTHVPSVARPTAQINAQMLAGYVNSSCTWTELS